MASGFVDIMDFKTNFFEVSVDVFLDILNDAKEVSASDEIYDTDSKVDYLTT